jgi:dolichyl-phosphate beta-glucosyltransferase
MDAMGPEEKRHHPPFSLVFPTYNALSFIDQTWRQVSEFLADVHGRWEIIFVCDGCTDGTENRLRELTQDAGPLVRVVDYPVNRGKGHAVRHGLLEAVGQYRLFTDVDLAYRFEDVQRVAASLEAGADAAIASRLHPDSKLILPIALHGYAYRRHIQSQVFSSLVRMMLPLEQRDTQAGLKGLSAAAARRLLPSLTCDGFGFDCELLLACRQNRLPVREVPVTMSYQNQTSTTSWRTVRQMVQELWSIRRSWKAAPPLPQPAPGLTRQAA